MPLQTIYLPEHYSGNGAQDVFPFTWRILAKTDLVVITKIVATGLKTTLELDSDYTIDDADVDTDDGGDVVLTDPLPTGTDLFLVRGTAKTQLVEILEGGTFPAAVVMKTFDRLTMMIQEQQYLLRQTLHFSLASTFKDVEVADLEAGKLLAANSTLDQIIMTGVASLATLESPFVIVSVLAGATTATIPHSLGASAKLAGNSQTWLTEVAVQSVNPMVVEFGTEPPPGGGTLIAMVTT